VPTCVDYPVHIMQIMQTVKLATYLLMPTGGLERRDTVAGLAAVLPSLRTGEAVISGEAVRGGLSESCSDHLNSRDAERLEFRIAQARS
jgi:hypothetical protein